MFSKSGRINFAALLIHDVIQVCPTIWGKPKLIIALILHILKIANALGISIKSLI